MDDFIVVKLNFPNVFDVASRPPYLSKISTLLSSLFSLEITVPETLY